MNRELAKSLLSGAAIQFNGESIDANGPSIVTIQEQLGLKLEPAEGAINVLVIESGQTLRKIRSGVVSDVTIMAAVALLIAVAVRGQRGHYARHTNPGACSLPDGENFEGEP